MPNAVDPGQFDAPPSARKPRLRFGLTYAPTTFNGLYVMLSALAIAGSAFGKLDPEHGFFLPVGHDHPCSAAQEEMPRHYASCDSWPLGSRSEGSGLPLPVAMACRTPVVATGAGAVHDLIKPRVSGYLADIDVANVLAAWLVDFVSLSPERWQSISEAAPRFTWDDAADDLRAALTRITAWDR